jgi:hypothetical protein
VCLGRVLLDGFDVLRILAGAEYLRAFEANRLEVLARLSIGAHGAAYGVGLVLAGLRSTTFCYLWLKSGFIPRALALFGGTTPTEKGLADSKAPVHPQSLEALAAMYQKWDRTDPG